MTRGLPWLLTALLALPLPAHAHVPHDTALALAAPAALDASAAWWLVGNPQGTSLLFRSDDLGRTWALVGGEPLMDTLLGAAQLDDGAVVLLSDRRFWWSGDAGGSWSRGELPGAVTLVAGGGALLLAGADGIWRGQPGEGLTHELDLPIVALGAGPTAADADGGVWRREGPTWTALGAPAGGLLSVGAVANGSEVWAGAADGQVWRWDGVWTACGALPEAEHPQVVGIAVAEDRDDPQVIVATAEHAGWTSLDGCASWVDRGPPDDASWEVEGGVTNMALAWPVLAAAGDVRVAGGWAGLYTSTDGGRRWTDAPLVPADHTRGLAFSRAFGEDGLVYVGGYGAGVLRSDDGGRTFTAPGHGLRDENVQRVVVADDPADAARIFTVSGHEPWLSTDHGTTWAPFGPELGAVDEVFPWCSAEATWVFLDGGGGIVATQDGGETFEILTLPLLGARPEGAIRFPAGARTCVTAREPSTLVCQEKGEWTAWYTSAEATYTTAPVAWPPSEPDRVVFADSEGVHIARADGWDTTLEDEDPPALLVGADDGTLLLATRSGRILRSADGGDTWVDPGHRLPATPQVLAARPAFADHPDVLVGTHDGTYLLSGEDPPVRWGGYQRLDDTSAFFDRHGLPEAVTDDGAGMDTVQPLAPESRLAAWMRGDALRVIGTSDGVGRVELSVDGVVVATMGAEVVELGALAELDGLGEGWHTLALVGVVDGVAIDAVEAWGAATALSEVGDGAEAPPGPCVAVETQLDTPGRCGCGGSGAILWLAAGVWRRRRV